MTLEMAAEAVSAVVGDRVVVMTPDLRFLELDTVGAEIWDLLRAGAGVAEIASTLTERYVVDLQTATSDTVRFIAQLADEGLVTISEP